MADVTPLPARARSASPNSPDMHPIWSDGTPVLLGQYVTHATERWYGVVEGIPSTDEIIVSWNMGDAEWTDGEEHAPEDLLRARV